jgi:hypothetical protein
MLGRVKAPQAPIALTMPRSCECRQNEGHQKEGPFRGRKSFWGTGRVTPWPQTNLHGASDGFVTFADEARCAYPGRISAIGNAYMPPGRPAGSNWFKCPHCDALYQVVRAEAGPETNDSGEITCRACGGLLPGGEGRFILKYFLLRDAVRGGRRRKALS